MANSSDKPGSSDNQNDCLQIQKALGLRAKGNQMKLEVPNARIMAGELAYLSPPACKLLFTLVGCQDTNSLLPIVTISKTAIAKKSGYTSRQVYRLLKELEEQNWINRKGSIIIIKSELSTMSQVVTRDVTTCDKALTCVKKLQPMTRDVTHSDINMSHDPISTEEEDQITTYDIIPIAEHYGWNHRQVGSLLTEFNGKSKQKLEVLFTYMQRHADTIDKPLAYMRKAMRNPGMDMFKAILSEMI